MNKWTLVPLVVVLVGCVDADPATGLPSNIARKAPASVTEPLKEGDQLLDKLGQQILECVATVRYIKGLANDARQRERSSAAKQLADEAEAVGKHALALHEEYDELKDAMDLLRARVAASTTCETDPQVRTALDDVRRRIADSREALRRAQASR